MSTNTDIKKVGRPRGMAKVGFYRRITPEEKVRLEKVLKENGESFTAMLDLLGRRPREPVVSKEEAKAFIAREIKLMRDAEPKYHQYP